MNDLPQSSVGPFQELYAWCQTARNLYASASQNHDSPGLRALKVYLAERNAEHLRDVRQILHRLGAAESPNAFPYHTNLPGLGNEIMQGLNSSNRALVLLACGQVEKQLALAYEKAWHNPALTDTTARAIVSRHITDLKASQEFVHQIETEQGRRPNPTNRDFATT